MGKKKPKLVIQPVLRPLIDDPVDLRGWPAAEPYFQYRPTIDDPAFAQFMQRVLDPLDPEEFQ